MSEENEVRNLEKYGIKKLLEKVLARLDTIDNKLYELEKASKEARK